MLFNYTIYTMFSSFLMLVKAMCCGKLCIPNSGREPQHTLQYTPPNENPLGNQRVPNPASSKDLVR